MVVVSFKEEVMRIAKEWVCALTLFVILAGVLSASAQRLDGGQRRSLPLVWILSGVWGEREYDRGRRVTEEEERGR